MLIGILGNPELDQGMGASVDNFPSILPMNRRNVMHFDNVSNLWLADHLANLVLSIGFKVLNLRAASDDDMTCDMMSSIDELNMRTTYQIHFLMSYLSLTTLIVAILNDRSDWA